MLKNDLWIREQAQKGMITPFVSELVRVVETSKTVFRNYSVVAAIDEDGFENRISAPGYTEQKTQHKVISFGASSYGYDLRLSPKEFRIFRHVPGTVVNPKAFNSANLIEASLHEDEYGQYFILPAHSYGLGVAMERLEIPDNITCLFIGKSTYCRAGIIANLTPGEAGWKGHLTLEFSNSSSADCRIYANEGIVQALFLEGDACETTYGDRAGKYQDQPECVVLAKV